MEGPSLINSDYVFKKKKKTQIFSKILNETAEKFIVMKIYK